MLSFFKKLTGNKKLANYRELSDLIGTFEADLKPLSDAELRGKTNELKNRLKDGEELDMLLPEAFAAVREASMRTLGLRHFDVQLMGGIALHEGHIAEMRTGEGKTLVATLSAYLNAIPGEGVHVVTVNDYLAKRDAVWMGQVYDALGLSVSVLAHESAFMYDPSFTKEKSQITNSKSQTNSNNENLKIQTDIDKRRDMLGGFQVFNEFLRPVSRKEAYAADITYGTNHEFGFDYLRDNLVPSLSQKAQRKHSYSIIDEVDSILIDEARTPLIISAPDAQSSEFYKTFARVVERLSESEDYLTDEKTRSVSILDPGIEKVQKIIGVENLYDPDHSRLVHFLQESLRAKALFRKDKDYVVKNGEIFIVDEFTGRILEGRRYSGGLHQAIEAKEGVFVKEESRTYAQITIQNYFRMYKKIAGMTGTAETSAEEFHKVYGLEVILIPTNKEMIRKDASDRIYKTMEAKYKAVAQEIKERSERGQPLLVGTASIDHNERLSALLAREGVRHEVLNAKNNEREAQIIAQAGRKGAVTIATNMAGRGVDIVLGGNPPKPEEAEEIRSFGGLHVIGTERHEARRIDNQLRGRAGRQGDPGSTQFFLSLEDDVVRIFGGDRIGRLMETLNFPEDTPIESKMVTNGVNQAQQKIEGINFDIRKHLLEFDDVLNKQRTAIYLRRDKFLEAGEKNEIVPLAREILSRHAERARAEAEKVAEAETHEEAEKRFAEIDALEKRIADLPDKIEPERAKMIAEQLIRISDVLWVEHLENLEGLRESVNIRAYAQHDPIVEYRREGHFLYHQLNANFDGLVYQTVFPLFSMDIMRKNTEQTWNNAEANPPAGGAPPKGAEHIGRNDPCWCGSGKKFKKCHGK